MLCRSMHLVATSLCDIVISLAADLRVCDTDSVYCGFFGRDIHGRPFTELLVGYDKEARFQPRIDHASASQAPVCLHVTLQQLLDRRCGRIRS